jgi:hypothetical protein
MTKTLQKILPLFLVCLSSVLCGQFKGVVLDSIGNPVQNANICKIYNGSIHANTCQKSDRWGQYFIRLIPEEQIRIEIKYDSIPDVLKFYVYKEDPFDGVGSITEIEYIENNTQWTSNQYDTIINSKKYPIKNKEENSNYDFRYYFSKIEIEQDSAILLSDFEYVKGRLSFDLDLSYSISERLNTPKLQDTYVQGRPSNGVLHHFGAPEPFSWGPNIQDVSGLASFDPNQIFQRANAMKLGFNASYKRKDNVLNVNFVTKQEEGLLKPIENQYYSAKLNFNFPAWDGTFKTSLGASWEEFNMPLVGNNYMNVLHAAWNSPFHFNASEDVMNGGQNSASEQYNNFKFLLNYNRDKKQNQSYNAGLHYDVQLDKWKLNGGVSHHYTHQDLGYGKIPGMVQVVEPNFFQRKFDEHLTKINLEANYDHNYEFKLKFYFYQTLQNSKLKKDQFRSTTLANYPEFSNPSNLYQTHLSRFNGNLGMTISYQKDLGDLSIENDLSQGLFLTNTNKQSLAYFINNVFTVDSEYILGDLNINLGVRNTILHTEPELISHNLNFNSLNQSLHNFIQYTEPKELIIFSKLKYLEQKTTTEIFINPKIRSVFDLTFSYYYSKIENAFAPIYSNNQFMWENVANYHQQGIEINLAKGWFLNNSRNFKWDFNLNFHKYTNETDKILIDQERVPIFGFQEVSKNFVEGQPVGVIVGSDYLRDQAGNVIIGDHGFPIVDDNLKIIADPTPDFSLKFFNEVKLFNFYVSANLEWQKGGEIWNGTQNTLNYFGRSQLSGDWRNTTNYIFEGVNQNGEINTIPVDFANPSNDLSENRWVRYGPTGVASDAIEDASFFRLQNLTLSYRTKLKQYHHSPITQFTISVFANNLWVSSKYSGVFPANGLLGNDSGRGLDYYNFPLARTFGIALNLKF